MADELKRHPSRDALEAWLTKVKARFRWREQVGGFGDIRAYEANGRVFFVHDMATERQDFGWEVYVPASDSNTVKDTLFQAEIALGITPHTVTLETRPNPHRDAAGRPYAQPEFIFRDLHGTLHVGAGVLLHDLVKDVTGEKVKAGDTVHLTIQVETEDDEETKT